MDTPEAGTPEQIRPYTVDVPQDALDDLTERLSRVRWAEELPASELVDLAASGPVQPGWQYGVPGAFVRPLVERWRTDFDWRAAEARLNAHPQFTTVIDGQRIHFIHVRSTESDALPLVLTHGWPNSVVEYLDLISPLTDPVGHGGAAADAFDVVVPSLPGFGFSGPTHERGWNRYRVAHAWVTLMERLGYDRFGAHGNDAGALVSPEVGRAAPDRVVGVHVTQLFSFPTGDPAEFDGLTAEEVQKLQFLQTFNDEMSAYAHLQGTAPQNVAHALADSPVGQLAWSAQLLAATSEEHLLTNASLYWLTNTAASAARFYYEDRHTEPPSEPTTVATGLASFANDFTPLRRFADRDHAAIVSWNEYDRGGHWATQDAPDLLLDDIRTFYRGLR